MQNKAGQQTNSAKQAGPVSKVYSYFAERILEGRRWLASFFSNPKSLLVPSESSRPRRVKAKGRLSKVLAMLRASFQRKQASEVRFERRDVFRRSLGGNVEHLEGRALMATLAAWDFTGENTALATSTADVTGSNLDVVGTLSRGAGAAASAASNSFRTTGFQNNGISTANTDYFQTTLSASPGFTLSLNTLDAKFAGTASFANSPGVSSQFAYSLDGSTFTLIGSSSATVGTPATMTTISLAGVSALQNVPDSTTITLRYYASGQTSTGGWGFNSPSAGQFGFAIDGAAASVATPSITGAATALAFTTTYGTVSAAQTFSVSGNNLTANLIATAPTGFEVSSGGAYGATATFTQASGSASGTLSVRLAANAGVAGTYNSQNIVLSSTGATSVNIATAASGNTVSAAALTITGVTASNKTYNATTAATLTGTPAYSGLVNGETFSVSGTPSASFADKNVGTGKSVTVTGYTAPNANYTLSQPSGLTADISAASLTIGGITADTRVYDTTTNATISGTASLSGVIGGDTVSVDGTPTASFTTKTVGTAKAVTVTGYSISGTDSGNYTLTQPTLIANITSASLAIIGVSAVSRDYNASTSATLSGTASLNGVQGSDVVTVGGTPVASFATKIAETAKAVTVTGYSISGIDSGNYTVSQPTGLTADINVLAITGSITAGNKAFDGTDSATITSRTLTGAILGDVVSYVGGTATFDDATVGNSKLVTATGLSLFGADASNYSVNTTATTTANITSGVSAPTITFTSNPSPIYNGNAYAASATTDSDGAITYSYYDGADGTGSVISAPANAGSYSVVASTASTSNFSAGSQTLNFTIAAKSLTVAISATGRTYDGTNSASVTYLLSGIVNSDDVAASGTATFDNKNVGTSKTVTATGIALAGAASGNYFLSVSTATTTADISAKSLTISATASSKTYDGTTTAIATLGSLIGVVDGDVVTAISTSASFADKNVGTAKTILVSGIALGGTEASNYSISSTTTASADITVASLIATASGTNRAYDGTTIAGVAISLSGILLSDVVTATGTGSFADKDVGIAKNIDVTGITLAGADAGNYTVNTTATASADITAKALTVSATAGNRVYDLTTAASASLNALSGVVGSDDVSATFTTASFIDKNVGTAKTVSVSGISLTGADAGNYSISSSTTATANITAASVTVASITGVSKVYNGTTAATATATLDGVLGSDIVTATGTGTFTLDKNVGTGKAVSITAVTLAGTDSGNYVVIGFTTTSTTADITAKALTSVVTVSSKNYDGTNSALITGRTLVGVVTPDVVTVSGGVATFDDNSGAIGLNKSVSITGLTLAGVDAGNYSIGTATATASIGTGLAAGEVAFTAFQADNTGGGFNGDAFSFVLLKPVVTGTTVFFTDNGFQTDVSKFRTNENVVRWVAQADLTAGTKISFIAPGGTGQANTAEWTGFTSTTGAIALTTAFGLAGSGDNIAALQNPTFGGSEQLTGTALAQLTFGGATFATTFTIASGNATTALAPGLTDGVNAISLAATDNGKYNDAAVGSVEVGSQGAIATSLNTDTFWTTSATPLTPPDTTATFTVLAESTIVVTSANAEYNGNAYSASASVTGSTGTITFTYYSGANGTGTVISAPTAAGSYSVIASVAADSSFASAVSTAANFTITQKALTATATATNKIYNGTTAAEVAVSLSGVVSSDDVTATGTGTFADKNVGTGISVSVSGITLSGAKAANYSVNTSTTTTADITAKALTATISSSGKTYDGSDSATVSYSLSGVEGTESVTASGTAIYDSKNVGTGKTITATGITLGGADAGNYTVNGSATTTADISAKTLTATISASNKVYTATTAASVSYSLSGVVGSELVSASGTAVFSDKNVGTGKTVTASGITLAGDDAGNYSVNNSATTTADISAATASVSISASDKTYDGSASATVSYTVTGLLLSDVATASGSASFDTKNAGSGKTVTATGITLSGTDAGNYTINTTATTTASIATKALTASISSSGKTYDGTTSATVSYSLAGVVGSEDVVATGSAIFDTKNVGTGKTITASNIVLNGIDAGNYTVNGSATTTADITAKALTATISAAGKTYDATTAAASVTYSLAGVISGEVVTASGSASFANKNVGTDKTVTATGITLGDADAGNYSVNSTATTTADISAASLVASATASNKTYDRTTDAIVTVSLSGVLGSDVVSATGTGAFTNKNVGLAKPIDVSGIALTGADSGNYVVNSTTTATADISALAITGSVTINNKVYDSTDSATIATRTLFGVINGDLVSYVDGTATFDSAAVGTGKTVTVTGLSLSGADAGNYTVNSSTTATADITDLVQSQTISFTNPGPKTYGDAAFELVATSSSGLAVSFHVVSGPATISGSTLTITAAGDVVVEATQAGNASYTAAAPVQQSFTVAQKTLTASATVTSKTYDGTTSATPTISLSGVVGTDIVSASGSAAFADKNAGTGKSVSISGITLSGVDAANYTVSNSLTTSGVISAKALIASISASNKTYNATDAAAVTYSLAGVVGTELVTASGSATFADKNVGAGKLVTATGISLVGADAVNYSVNSSATTTADITAASLTASISAESKTYDGTTSAVVVYSLSGVFSGDLVTADGTASFASKSAGLGKTVTATGISLTGSDASNYVVNDTATTTADISQKDLLASITASSKVYSATTSATVSYSLAGVVGSDLVIATGTASFEDKNVGTNKIVTASGIAISGADASNYTVNGTTTALADITPASLVATVVAANRVYNATDAALVTVSLSGVLGSDSVTGSGDATFANKNVGTGKIVNATGITLAGTDKDNYTVNDSASTTADITAAPVTVSISASSKTYDATNSADVTYTASGVFAGDDATASGTATFANKNVGSGKTVTATGIALSGSDSGNYTVNSSATTTANITAASVTATISASGKTYDGTTTADVTYSVSGVIGSDVVGATGTASFDNKSASLGKTVTATGISLTGLDAGNYIVNTTATTTADISAKALVATITGTDKTYDATTAAVVSYSLSGVVGSDAVTASGTASFDTKNVGTNKAVSASSIALNGADASNYTVNSTASTTASVSVATLTASITATNKTYDATTSATVSYTLSGVAGTDVVTASGTASFANKSVGLGKSVTATGISISGADASNYTVNSSATTTANITALVITGSITAADKSFDGTTSAIIATKTLTGVLGTDVVSYTGGTATFDTAAVGTGKTVTATGLALSGADALNYTVNSIATTTASIAAVNNAPTFTNNTPSFSLFNKAAVGTVVGTVAATDIDAGQSIAYSLSGTHAAAFAIDSTGKITVANANTLKTLSSPVSLTVTATDNGPTPQSSIAVATIILKSKGTAPAFAGFDTNSSTISIAGGKATVTMIEHTSTSASINGSVVATLSVTDADEAAGTSFTIKMDADKSGAFDFNALTGEVYVKDASLLDFEKTSSFKLSFSVTDHGLAGLTGTITTKLALTVNLTNFNDAPTISFKDGKNVGQAVTDNKTITPFASMTIGDADGSKVGTVDSVTVMVSFDPAKGTLTNLAATALVVTNPGPGVYTVAGNAKLVTSALSKVKFVPTPNRVAVGSTETTIFNVAVTDGSAPTVSDHSTTVITTSANDTPTVLGTVAKQEINDKQTATPFSGVTIGDVDVVADGSGQILSVTVALDKSTKGVFSSTSLTASGFAAGTTAGSYTFSGTAAQATAAIRLLEFVPAANSVKPLKTDTTKFSISVTDPIVGSRTIVNKVSSVITTSVNDDATISGVTTGAQTVNDKATVTPFSSVVIGDVDSGAKVTVTITLSNGANGVLVGGFKKGSTAGVYTFTGTPGQATAAIQALAFKPTENLVAPGSTTTTGFSISVKDTDSAVATVNLATTVLSTSVNDTPTILGTKAGTKVDAGKSVVPFGKVVIRDPDLQSVTVTIRLSDALDGTFTTLGGFATGGTAGTYTFTGTASEAQNAIRLLAFTPALNRVAKGLTKTTTFEITVDDGTLVATDTTTTVISTQKS